ncbi:MAG TPA: hypothetical protein VMZ26_10005 [Pyrinomonadaceae bacterium]|nr:hypothetical protein [Pyrinomonadaceae bacterium]
MDNSNKLSSDELKIQRLLEAFLLSRNSLKSSAAETSFHIDEDFLTAFTEGNLSERESLPVVEHLTGCGFCRNKTAELVRLDLAFRADAEDARTAPAAEPHKISEVLSGLLTKIFGTADGAVFAHNEEEAIDKNEKDHGHASNPEEIKEDE